MGHTIEYDSTFTEEEESAWAVGFVLYGYDMVVLFSKVTKQRVYLLIVAKAAA